MRQGKGQDYSDDLMAKVFEKKTHEAYERRAKSDKMVDYIANKFLANAEDKARAIRLSAVAQDFTNDDDEEKEMQRAKAERKKLQQQEMKEMLDMQIKLQNHEKIALNEEKKAMGKRIQLDTADYEAEQTRKRSDHIAKQKAHQKEVTKQIEQRS